MKVPWHVPTGIAVLASSMLPAWMIDLTDAPTETSIRFWTTLIVGAALFATWRGVAAFRWVLALLLLVGVAGIVAGIVQAGLLDMQSVLITLAQAFGLGLLFAPTANAWFRERRATPG